MAKIHLGSFGVISSIDKYLLVRVLKDLTAPSALHTLMLGNGPLDGPSSTCGSAWVDHTWGQHGIVACCN